MAGFAGFWTRRSRAFTVRTMRQNVIDRPAPVADLESQRKDLVQRLQALESQVATLRAERESAQAEAFEALVGEQLGADSRAVADASTRVENLDAAIARQDTAARAVRAALDRIDLSIADANASLKAEARIARRAEAREMLAELIPLTERYDAMARRYNQLRAEFAELPPAAPLGLSNLATWLAAAKRVTR
jgi:chromosome segregation ATPase